MARVMTSLESIATALLCSSFRVVDRDLIFLLCICCVESVDYFFYSIYCVRDSYCVAYF